MSTVVACVILLVACFCQVAGVFVVLPRSERAWREFGWASLTLWGFLLTLFLFAGPPEFALLAFLAFLVGSWVALSGDDRRRLNDPAQPTLGAIVSMAVSDLRRLWFGVTAVAGRVLSPVAALVRQTVSDATSAVIR